ncbi:DNA-methyltransferase [Halomonas sp. AOP42-B2-16]|uniref:DNA-methyltransferase n=1 Tax=Halomonas sp. AOP42-B2-16 TaxID=3457673 RepID=UPI004033D401
MAEVTLLNCDCMAYMRGLPDKAFDLAIVDPPYGIGESGGNESRNRVASNSYAKKAWDNEAPPVAYFNELQRVSRHQIIWGANHFIDRIGKASPCWIVWDKVNGASHFADCEMAYTSFKSAARIVKYMWAGHFQGVGIGVEKQQGNKALNEKRIHPTQKPIKLYEWLLANYAKPGQRILDTHLGSASSAIAAHYFGCEFVGTELDSDYFAAAKARFDRETAQVDMFGGVA